jgi:two-component system NtrC family sensor kinase
VRREGQITLRLERAGDRVMIQFVDDGPGIRAEHLARIFDPFFTTKPVGKGTGLGLSLCYGIIQEHGGTISARSEAGHGAIFTIDLPAAKAGDGNEDKVGSAAPFVTPAAGKERSVLVIDDEAWILDLAAELLRREGYLVETALDGQRAIEAIDRRHFDVIVSDWKMPGLNGIRLYEHLQADAPEAAKRIVFMTGDVVNDTFQDFLRERGLSCLSKPFAVREFKAAVAKVLSN